ncbi:MAG TPA: LysR family transcriptional regulator [Micromonosporaceae bacterium]|nr:LysR family transcriptional regulator [Micromonosporaceae bacterium]
MHSLDLAPSDLRILIAVHRERSFSAAAISLGLTQSAVSHAIRSAERKVGVVLFDRGRGGALPTAAGESVVTHARRVLRLLETMGREAQTVASGQASGVLRLATFRSAAVYLLPSVLERFSIKHPQVDIEVAIVRDVDRGLAGEVADGKADLALATVAPTTEIPASLISAELFAEPYWLIHPPKLSDLRLLPLITWDENCSEETKKWLAAQEWEPPKTIPAADDSVVLSMVAHGLGFAVMPRLSVANCDSRIAVQRLDGQTPTRHVGYVTTPEMAPTLAVREFIRVLRDCLTVPASATL